MNLTDRTYLWQHLGHRPTDDPAKLRWDAQDYRDAADLHFGHDPELLEDLAARPITVTPDEAAELLGVSRRQVDRWLAEGHLRRVPHTTRALIPRVALDEFVMGEAS